MRYLGYALLASPFVILGATIVTVSGLATALLVFGLTAGIAALVLAGAYLAFEY